MGGMMDWRMALLTEALMVWSMVLAMDLQKAVQMVAATGDEALQRMALWKLIAMGWLTVFEKVA